MVIDLRYYQVDGLAAIRQREKEGHRGAFLKMPTGTGKTIYTAEEAKRMMQEGRKMLVLAEREKLLEQARDKILDVYPQADIGMYGFGKRALDHQIVLGGVDTLSRPNHLAKIKDINFSYINIDESHHIASQSYRSIIGLFPNAFLLGQSATPERHDGKEIYSLFGCNSPTYEQPLLKMIEQEYLCPLRCDTVKTYISVGPIKMKKDGEDYDEDSLAQAIDREDRNTVIAQTCTLEKYGGPKIPSVTFAANKKHAQALCDEYNRHGIVARAVIDITTKEECDEIFTAFARWDISMLVTVTKLIEGWDADVRRIIMAAGTKSVSRYIQEIGRGTRTAPGKEFCWVVDFTDNSDIHSLEPLSLASVLDLPELETGGDVLEAIKTRREKGEALPGEETSEEAQQTFMGGELVYKEKQLHKHVDWSQARGGNYLTCVGDDRIILSPTIKGQYNVVIDFWDAKKGEPRYELIDANKPLSWAQALAEGYKTTLEKGYRDMLDPKGKSATEPMTPGQKKQLENMKVHVPYGYTKAQAGKLINDTIAKYRMRGSKKKTVKQEQKGA